MRADSLCALLPLALAACLLPASERVELDRRVGRATFADTSVEVEDGLAAVRSFDGEQLELWTQAPELRIQVTQPVGPSRPLRLDVHNCVPGSTLQHADEVLTSTEATANLTRCRFELALSGDAELLLRAPGGEQTEPFVFAVLSDIQDDIGRVHDIFEVMNRDPELRFVVSTGDLVETGTRAELLRFQRELQTLRAPLYSTVGNHEMGAPPSAWHSLFGPFNVHFRFRGVTFSLVDSGNGSIDPDVYDWLDGWLSDAKDGAHIVLTHVPPLDPVGLRGGGFRSRKEAAKLLRMLGEGRVDALFLGHIHSFYGFSAAGVPTYISGGGGAIPETLDGIDRHYLRVRVDPAHGIEDVAIVRVD